MLPQPLAYLYLSQIPYTGLDLGPIGTALYWTALVGWSLALAYLILFAAVPVVHRRARDFGSRVKAALNARTLVLADRHVALSTASADKTTLTERLFSEPPREYSSYDGFKSYARNGALSIEDIVKSLSRKRHKTPVEPVYEKVEPIYEHTEPVYENVEPIAAAASGAGAVPPHIRGFTAALVEGDRAAVFAGLRQQVRGAGAPEQLLSAAACLIDDVYRSRIDRTPCDPDIARLTARLDTPTLERIVAALATAIDSSYSADMTGAKLALTRALAVLGA